jgi:Cu-Zn family superoxide dismutase
MKEMTNTAPAPAAKPAANDEVGWGAVTATIAPTTTRPNRRGRETAMGGTAGIIGSVHCIIRVLMKEEGMKKLGIAGTAGLAAVGFLLLTGAAAASDNAPEAKATIESKSGSHVTGKAVFTQLPSGAVRVEVWIEGAPPGTHGLHIHEKGDCSAPDGTSAGGHFNPAGNPHAGPSAPAHHNGDLGNIEIGADGKGHLEITTNMLSVKPGPNSVVGRSIIFHEKADDLKTQPTGAAGGRLGCGVIR